MTKPNTKLIAKALDMLTKSTIDTGDLASGGIMTVTQQKKFLQIARDQSALLKKVRLINMPSSKHEIDKIGVGSRQMRGASENEDVSNNLKKPNFTKIELDSQKYALPWELTEETLEDNIEKGNLATVVRNLFAEQFGLDSEDVALNGNDTQPAGTLVDMAGNIDAVTDPITLTVDSTAGYPRNSNAGLLLIDTEKFSYESITATTFVNCGRAQDGTTIATHLDNAPITYVKDALIGVDNGWFTIALAGASNFVDLSAINSGNIDSDHFFALYEALPPRFSRGSRKTGIKWMMSTKQWIKYLESLSNRLTTGGDAATGGVEQKPVGIGVIEVPAMPDDAIILTNPKNFIWGVQRGMKVRRDGDSKDMIARDVVFWNITSRFAMEIEEVEGVAIGTGLTP